MAEYETLTSTFTTVSYDTSVEALAPSRMIDGPIMPVNASMATYMGPLVPLTTVVTATTVEVITFIITTIETQSTASSTPTKCKSLHPGSWPPVYLFTQRVTHVESAFVSS